MRRFLIRLFSVVVIAIPAAKWSQRSAIRAHNAIAANPTGLDSVDVVRHYGFAQHVTFLHHFGLALLIIGAVVLSADLVDWLGARLWSLRAGSAADSK